MVDTPNTLYVTIPDLSAVDGCADCGDQTYACTLIQSSEYKATWKYHQAGGSGESENVEITRTQMGPGGNWQWIVQYSNNIDEATCVNVRWAKEYESDHTSSGCADYIGEEDVGEACWSTTEP